MKKSFKDIENLTKTIRKAARDYKQLDNNLPIIKKEIDMLEKRFIKYEKLSEKEKLKPEK